MIETALVAFTTMFATIGPVDIAVLFATLTASHAPALRRQYAIKGSLIGGGLLLFFALFGEVLLSSFGITLPALRTAGGVLLLLIAIDMVFARSSGGVTTTREETAEAATRQDISVFPLATPLIAGPGAIGAVILLVANARPDWLLVGVVIAVIIGVVLMTFLLMLIAGQVSKLLGVTGVHVLSRVMGVVLAALAVQFMFDGLAASGLLG